MSLRLARRRLLMAYPRPWRERYEEEMIAYLDDELGEGRLPASAAADLVLSGVAERSRRLFDAPATSASTIGTNGWGLVAWGWWICAVGGFGVAKESEHFGTQAFVSGSIPHGHAAAGASMLLIKLSAAIALIALAAAAAPAVLVAARLGGAATRSAVSRAAIAAAAAAGIAAAWVAGVAIWAHTLPLLATPASDHTVGVVAVATALVVAGALGVVTRVAVVAFRMVRPASNRRALPWLAWIAAGCAAVVAFATGMWWASMAQDAPGFLGPIGASTGWWRILLAQLAIVTGAALALAGAWRARGSGSPARAA